MFSISRTATRESARLSKPSLPVAEDLYWKAKSELLQLLANPPSLDDATIFIESYCFKLKNCYSEFVKISKVYMNLVAQSGSVEQQTEIYKEKVLMKYEINMTLQMCNSAVNSRGMEMDTISELRSDVSSYQKSNAGRGSHQHLQSEQPNKRINEFVSDSHMTPNREYDDHTEHVSRFDISHSVPKSVQFSIASNSAPQANCVPVMNRINFLLPVTLLLNVINTTMVP